MNKYVIIISGATATGKSDFAIKVAEELHGEIINADIGSFYTALTIGTAKPCWKRSKIKHHLFDILKSPENFTIVQFRTLLVELIDQIWQRGHIPIIVGGSAFYIKACFFKQHNIANVSEITKQFEARTDENSVLWEELVKIDPKRASRIHSQDRYRIIRALAIYHATGKQPSTFEQFFDPIAPFYFINCQRDRKQLYQHIDMRVVDMLEQGWLQEVKELQGSVWEKFLFAKKIIGYDDLLSYLQNPNQISLQEVTAKIQQKTRNYAKRQIIFLNKLKKDVHATLARSDFVGSVEDINLTLCDVGLYIKGLSNRISKP